MNEHSEETIKDWFRTLHQISADAEDPFTLHDILWPCVLEEAWMESKDNNWKDKFWKTYHSEVKNNLSEIISKLDPICSYTKEEIIDYANYISE